MEARSFASVGLPRAGDPIGSSLRVVGALGGGEIGVVFLCDDEALGRPVAVKMLRPDRVDAATRVHTFLRVAREMANVTSAHVVAVYDLGLHQGLPYFVMEHVPGVELDRHRRDHGGALRVDAALSLALGVLRGLEVLHRNDIVHGALGPTNVLVAPDGRVVLTDAGMAEVVGGSLRPGAPPAPASQADAAPSPDRSLADAKRADVRAAATILYRSLVGRDPTVDPEAKRVLAPSELANTPMSLDAPLLEALLVPDSPLLETHELRREIERIARVRGGEGEAQRVLVVDANRGRAGATALALESALSPVQVRRAFDGPSAVEMSERVDLVVFDPEGFGSAALDVLAAIVEALEETDTPVLVLTEGIGASELRLLRGLGATSCIYRPIEPRVLASVAESLVRSARGARNRVSRPMVDRIP